MKKKLIISVFGKNIYLLGRDSDGINYWLESPSFDCGWYWGFGYVETYTNNVNPNLAKDINSHSHIDSGKYLISDELVNTTFSSVEKLKLIELFNTFYVLRKEADSNHRKNVAKWFKLNNVDIPNVMNEIIKILTPETLKPLVYSLPSNIKAE